jgi:hypothetical protein
MQHPEHSWAPWKPINHSDWCLWFWDPSWWTCLHIQTFFLSCCPQSMQFPTLLVCPRPGCDFLYSLQHTPVALAVPCLKVLASPPLVTKAPYLCIICISILYGFPWRVLAPYLCIICIPTIVCRDFHDLSPEHAADQSLTLLVVDIRPHLFGGAMLDGDCPLVDFALTSSTPTGAYMHPTF